VSFLATLAKFKATALTRPVALDVGRHTFMWLARAEWMLAVFLSSALFVAGLPTVSTAAFAALVVVLLLSAFWIAPALFARADAIIRGETTPPSSIHGIAVLGEAVKLLLLVVVAVAAFRDLLT
jgi:hypothetical protein